MVGGGWAPWCWARTGRASYPWTTSWCAGRTRTRGGVGGRFLVADRRPVGAGGGGGGGSGGARRVVARGGLRGRRAERGALTPRPPGGAARGGERRHARSRPQPRFVIGHAPAPAPPPAPSSSYAPRPRSRPRQPHPLQTPPPPRACDNATACTNPDNPSCAQGLCCMPAGGAFKENSTYCCAGAWSGRGKCCYMMGASSPAAAQCCSGKLVGGLCAPAGEVRARHARAGARAGGGGPAWAAARSWGLGPVGPQRSPTPLSRQPTLHPLNRPRAHANRLPARPPTPHAVQVLQGVQDRGGRQLQGRERAVQGAQGRPVQGLQGAGGRRAARWPGLLLRGWPARQVLSAPPRASMGAGRWHGRVGVASAARALGNGGGAKHKGGPSHAFEPWAPGYFPCAW